MRSGNINATSPREDVWGTLTGAWDEYDHPSGWHVVVTPFFTAISGTFSAGIHELPFRFSGNVQLSLSFGDGGGSVMTVKARQQAVSFDRACMAQAVVFGDATRAVPV